MDFSKGMCFYFQSAGTVGNPNLGKDKFLKKFVDFYSQIGYSLFSVEYLFKAKKLRSLFALELKV